MKLKIVSIFLLCLFCIVIAFPGYGSSARVTRTHTIMYADQDIALFSKVIIVLKKCLSKGINMIEEERSSEDETGASVVFECIVYGFADVITILNVQLYAYQRSFYQTTALSIYTPPDCLTN